MEDGTTRYHVEKRETEKEYNEFCMRLGTDMRILIYNKEEIQ